ncbi:MAG: iron-sulfur cluster assembly accessory protein [Cytophagaceae bacterium]|jgi:iron-sulfur cluster assembly protein|nr:iron-sulfur cluster assembly accessory protein [Cytophagaceae bacterium]
MDVLPFEISSDALAEIEKIYASKNIPAHYHLRIGVKGGGCSGISYVFGFDEQGGTDLIFPSGSISFLVDKRHMLYVAGLRIGFENSAEAYGFTFESPSGLY